MPNTNPLTTTAAALADKVSRATHRMHCDFAFWVGGATDNVARHSRAGASAGRRRNQGVHGLLHRLAARRRRCRDRGDPAPDATARGVPQRGRGEAQRAQGPARAGRSLLAPCLARRDHGAAVDAAARSHRAGDPRNGARAACLDRGGDRFSERPQGYRQRRGDAASPHPFQRRLRAARHEAADESAGARGPPSRSHLAWRQAKHRRYSRLRSCAAYAGGESQALSAKPVRA